MKPQSIQLASIVGTVETQSRCAINPEVWGEYAERMEAGDKFPPVIIYQDTDEKCYLADGFHRVAACLKNGYKDVLAEVRPGTQKDALKYSIGANRTNGLCRTAADKRHCVRLALDNFGDMSSRAIAELVGVGHELVDKVRAVREDELTAAGGRTATCRPATRLGKDGKRYPLPTPVARPAPAITGEFDAPDNEDRPRIVQATPEESKRIQETQAVAAISALLPKITPAELTRIAEIIWGILPKVNALKHLEWLSKQSIFRESSADHGTAEKEVVALHN